MQNTNIVNIYSKLQNKNMPRSISNSYDTIIAKGCFIRGKQEFEGNCCLECEFDGEIIVKGDLLITENANIKANIATNCMDISGKVTGDIRCYEKLIIRAGAHVIGNILCSSIIIEEGAVFEGRTWMEEQKTAVGG